MATDKSVTVNRDLAEKERSLETALNQIERSFGKGSIMRLGDGSR